MPSANTVAELAVVVSADTSAAEKGLTDLGTKVGSAGSALQTAFAGAAVAGIGVVAAGLSASAVAATDFEKTMSGVKAVSGATSTEMEQLSGLALQLGKDTSFSASEAGKGIEELVKGGLTIPDIMNGAAKATLDLAAAGGVSLPEAATIAANALAEFNLKGQDMGHVADLIAGAANASALDVSDFSFSLKAAGAVAATVGFSFDDLAQGIAVMGKAGITGSDAGTSLKTMMMNLSPQTKKAKEEMQSLGIITADGSNQFFDAAGKVKSMAEVAQVLQTATADLTQEQKLNALQTMFGSDAIRAGAVLAKEGAAGFNEMAGAMSKVTAEAVGAEKLNNVAGSVEQLKGSLETMGIMIGLRLLPILKDFVDALTQAANDAMPAMEQAAKDVAATLADWIPTLKAVAGFLWDNRDAIAAVVAALGTFVILTTVVGWVTTLVTAVSAVTAAISASGGIMAALGALVAILGGPVTLVIAAIAVAVGALAYAWANDWGGIREKTAAVVEWLSSVPDTVSGYWDAIASATDALATAVSDAWLAILQSVDGDATSLQQLVDDTWANIYEGTLTAWDAIATFLTDWWREILVALTGPIGLVAVFVIDHWEQIKTATETIFRAVANVLIAIWGEIYTQIIRPQLDAISTAVSDAWTAISTTTTEVFNAVLAFVRDAILTPLTTAWTTATDALATAWTATINGISTLAHAVLDPLISWWQATIWTPIETAVTTASTNVTNAWTATINGVSTLAHSVLDALLSWWNDTIWGPMSTTVSTAMGAAETAFSTAVGSIKTTVDTTMASVHTAWMTMWGAIETAAKSPADALKVVTDAVEKLKGVMPDWLIPHSPTPLQIGIEGIAEATRAMSKSWQSMANSARSLTLPTGEIADYIAAAAKARGIDPGAALAIAEHEGGTDEPAKRGTFATGSSWWPFQLHYGGAGTPWAFLGNTAGMGNDFTAKTGWQPGDPKAWKDSIDFALDHAAKYGWGAWYGRGPAGVGAWEGIPGHAAGGWAGLHGPELAWLGERGPEYVVPNAALSSSGVMGGATQHITIDVAIGGAVAEQIYVTGRDLAVRRGRATAGVGTTAGPLSIGSFA